METEKKAQPKSLRERIMPRGSLREKLAGVAVSGVGSVIRSTDTVSRGLEMVTNKPPQPKADITPEQNQMEQEQSNQAIRLSGFSVNEDGSQGDRLPLKERLQLAVEKPTTARNLLSESELELVDILEPEEGNWLKKVKQRISGNRSEPTVALKADGLGEEVQITTKSDYDKEKMVKPTLAENSKLKVVPDPFWGPIAKASKHTGINPKKLAAQLGAESSFNPQAQGSSGEVGMPQFMPAAIEMVKKYWPQNFGQQYGAFDVSNPEHQILGYAVLTNYNKNHLLPSLGLEKPTEEEVALAHNSPMLALLWHLKRYDELINVAGVIKTVREQGTDYLNLLKDNGWDEE